VIIVEDDADIRTDLAELLADEGYRVSTAPDGAAALELLRAADPPCLILLDLMMPVMSGWDFCETLKKTPGWRSIPIVVLCGMAAEQRGKLQVDDAFEKPTDVSMLISRIAELCGI
jgi:CheY-like chemotaxis protein